MQFRKDIWRPLIAEATIEQIAAAGSLEGIPCRWLPGARALAYTADPFGYWHAGRLHVFFENFDYRSAHGTIGVHVLDADFSVAQSRIVLHEPWHLSYPFVFAWEGDVWMLPEASASGALTLYRASPFPWAWQPAARIELDTVPIDATLLAFAGSWWLFYAPAGSARERLTHLHLASAPCPTGPWTPHPDNPILVDPLGARPGGSAFEHRGQPWLPVQDCRGSYGSGLRLLALGGLAEGRVAVRTGPLLQAPAAAAPFLDGCHTLSQAGHVTLFDVKRRVPSLLGLAMRPLRNAERRLGLESAAARAAWVGAK